MEFACVNCGELFDEPQHYVEKHGLSYGPYEEWDGCPYCGGNYTEVFYCDCCNEPIQGEYILTSNNLRFCENCFKHMELGEED